MRTSIIRLGESAEDGLAYRIHYTILAHREHIQSSVSSHFSIETFRLQTETLNEVPQEQAMLSTNKSTRFINHGIPKAATNASTV